MLTRASLIIVFALAACATPALAQEPSRGATIVETPIEAIMRFKLRADPVEPMDFVKKSRPPEDQLQYIPVGAPPEQPVKPLLTFEALKAKEAALDGVRARHDRIGRRAPPKVKVNSVAYAPKPPQLKKRTRCLITCVVDPRLKREGPNLLQ